jgi:hypothetical protein
VPRREQWLAGAFIFLLLAAVHYDVVFLGKSFVLSNHHNPLDYRSLPQNYGDQLVPSEVWTSRNLYTYANIRDAGGPWWQWEPDGVFLNRAMKEGEWPFWDPYIGAGTPAMANMTPGYFFPPYTLVIALGGSVTLRNAYFFLLLWAAGFFTVLFLRLHGLVFIASLFGGAAVVMSGGLNQHIGTIGLQTAACLPVALYVTRRFIDSPSARLTGLLSLTYAAIALACFPPILMWLFGFTAVYALLAIYFHAAPGSDRRLLLGHWAGATALSVGLVAFFYAPALSLRAGAPYVHAFYEGAGLESIPLVNVLQLLSPTLAGGIPIYITPPVPAGHTPNIPYVGVVVLTAVLLVSSTAGQRCQALLYASSVTSILVLLKLFGIPPVQWIARLPIFEQIHYAHYFGMSLSFLLAFLAAVGVDALMRGSIGSWRTVVAVAIALAASESLWWYAGQFNLLGSTADRYWIRDWRVLNGLTVLTALAVLVGGLRQAARVAAGVALVVLVSAEGFFNNAYPSPKAWDIFKHPVPYVEVLKREPSLTRVLPFGALNANLNSAFEIFSFDSLMTINPPRAYSLYRRYTDPPPWLFLREARRIPPEAVLDRAAIGVLAIREAFPELVKEAQARGYTVRFNDGYVWLFERPTPPRFRFSTEYRVMRAPEVLTAAAQDPSRVLLLERPPGFPATPDSAADPVVHVEAYHLNSVSLTVDAPRPGLVYAAESYFAGWTATVNGQPARILPANYAFRAVEVPAGPSRIEFHYWPPGLTAGLGVSGTSVLGLAALVALVDRRRRTASAA